MMITIDEMKNQLRDKYLGRAGIHGFGIRRSRNVICVYLTEIGDVQKHVLEDIGQEATPFAVLAVEEPSPTVTPR
jgi:hypothetical protein